LPKPVLHLPAAVRWRLPGSTSPWPHRRELRAGTSGMGAWGA